MSSHIYQIKALVRSAKNAAAELTAGGTPTTLTDVLEDLQSGIFSSSITNGKTLVSTSKGGAAMSFWVSESLNPLAIAGMAEEALAWCQQFTDPNNPSLDAQLVTRLRANFSGGYTNL